MKTTTMATKFIPATKNPKLIPSMIFVIDSSKLPKCIERLGKRLEEYISEAEKSKNGGRVTCLRYLEKKLSQIKEVCHPLNKKDDAVLENARKAFGHMFESVEREYHQFFVDGNVSRVVESDYILDDLKAIHYEAAKEGIDLN